MGERTFLVNVRSAELSRDRQLADADKDRRRAWKLAQIKQIKADQIKPVKTKRKGKPKPQPEHKEYKRTILPYKTGMDKRFYDTQEWMRLRYKALKLLGRRCSCCGAQGQEIEYHVDHIKPRSKYPNLELDLSNLQILCRACNLGKSNTDEIDWRTSGTITQSAKA